MKITEISVWDDLTLSAQLAWADWAREGTDLVDTRTAERITGPIRLASQWVEWLAANPDRRQEAIEAYALSRRLLWYPRPGDWVVYTRVADRLGTYRLACSGSVVRVVCNTDATHEDGSHHSAHTVEGWWDGFNEPELVRWTALPGELRPATREEQAQGQLSGLGGL